jgi:hypothetical protein
MTKSAAPWIAARPISRRGRREWAEWPASAVFRHLVTQFTSTPLREWAEWPASVVFRHLVT